MVWEAASLSYPGCHTRCHTFVVILLLLSEEIQNSHRLKANQPSPRRMQGSRAAVMTRTRVISINIESMFLSNATQLSSGSLSLPLCMQIIRAALIFVVSLEVFSYLFI